MATIIAPNGSYTGVQGNISFANGVATFVQFESDEKEEMVTAILKAKGFIVMSDEEYIEKQQINTKARLKNGQDVAPLTGSDILPPVEGEDEDDDMDDDDNGLDENSETRKVGGKPNTVIKRNKGKVKK